MQLDLFPEHRKKEMDEFEEFWRKQVILTHITTKIKPSFFFGEGESQGLPQKENVHEFNTQ